MVFGDDTDERDAPLPADLAWDDDDDDSDDSVDCPACGQAVHPLAPKCPHCNHWILGDTPAGRRARGWFWPVIVALLVAVILVMWHKLGWH